LLHVHVGQVKPEDGGSILVATNHTWWWHNPEDYSLKCCTLYYRTVFTV
jgi:hypothetical protein